MGERGNVQARWGPSDSYSEGPHSIVRGLRRSSGLWTKRWTTGGQPPVGCGRKNSWPRLAENPCQASNLSLEIIYVTGTGDLHRTQDLLDTEDGETCPKK